MRVHASNFRIVGFTETPASARWRASLTSTGCCCSTTSARGCLIDTARFGLAPEPTVQDSVAAGADLTMFSGDKLLGGPQAGIIVGRADLVETLRRHPLARALRMDKGSIAALTATLLHYLRGEALEKLPVWRMIAEPLAAVRRRARRWARAIGPTANVVDGRSMIGRRQPAGGVPAHGAGGGRPATGPTLATLPAASAWATRRWWPASSGTLCCWTRAPSCPAKRRPCCGRSRRRSAPDGGRLAYVIWNSCSRLPSGSESVAMIAPSSWLGGRDELHPLRVQPLVLRLAVVHRKSTITR